MDRGNIIQEHLGGHNGITHIDSGVMEYLRHCGFTSLLDVGCGPAGNVLEARKHGMVAFGIDGDPTLQRMNNQDTTYMPIIVLHDYTQGPLPYSAWPEPHGKHKFDIGFSTEFLEHVEEKFIPNFMETFQRCNIVIVTHALPGETGGHHHVNLQTEEWWIDKFAEYGFTYNQEATNNIRMASTMRKKFIQKTGKVFFNDAWESESL